MRLSLAGVVHVCMHTDAHVGSFKSLNQVVERNTPMYLAFVIFVMLVSCLFFKAIFEVQLCARHGFCGEPTKLPHVTAGRCFI